MMEQIVNQRYRQFLLGMSGFIFLGTAVQLWFVEHFDNSTQLIAFILSGLGFAATVMVLLRARIGVIQVLRVVMLLVVLGSLFGIFVHFQHNLASALDSQPNAATREVLFEALKGDSPLLAPGILMLAALLALAATYYHPALETAIDI